MITNKQWGSFREYRQQEIEKIKNSPAFKEIEEVEAAAKLPQVKSFLGYTYKRDRDIYAVAQIVMHCHEAKASLLSHVPSETIEECLNWLQDSNTKKCT